MPTHVQVVLQHDVDNLGRSGDLVRVRPGYARNYLLPRGLAAIATRGNVERIEHEQRVALARAAKLRESAQGEAAKLNGLSLKIAAQVGEEGKLYGSVTAQDVADALKAQGFTVDRRKLQMPEDHIKQVGAYDVSVRLAPEVVATFKIDVVAA